ncbi:hypothetical protein VTH82DRAFT_665 [Thermothelomyces myriococcoides]
MPSAFTAINGIPRAPSEAPEAPRKRKRVTVVPSPDQALELHVVPCSIPVSCVPSAKDLTNALIQGSRPTIRAQKIAYDSQEQPLASWHCTRAGEG